MPIKLNFTSKFVLLNNILELSNKKKPKNFFELKYENNKKKNVASPNAQ